MTPLDAAWQAVLDAPDDDRALQVLADALMEREDPQGELIRLQLAGEEERATTYLSAHAAALLGDARHLADASLRFARGFVATARIETARDLAKLLDRPISRLVRELRMSSLAVLNDDREPEEQTPEPEIERIVRLIAQRGPLTIHALRFGASAAGSSSDEVTHLIGPDTPVGEIQMAPLLARLVSLEAVQLSAWQANFAGAQSASLRDLSIDLQSPVRALNEARFPALQALSLTLPFRRLDVPLSLLAGEVAPKLEVLKVSGALWPQQLHDLSVSALLRGLKRLEISAEAETGWYGALLETIDAFDHLEHVQLVADPHHPEWVAAVKAALPRVQIVARRLRL